MLTDQESTPSEGIRLRLQTLPGPIRALAIGALASLQSVDGVFSTRDAVELLRQLRLPPMANLSASLGRLREQGLVMRPTADTWSLTPMGESRLQAGASRIPTSVLAAEISRSSGSELGDQHHSLIPPLLAPIGVSSGLSRILGRTPFDQNVMLITRFPKGPEDHFSELIPRLRAEVAAHGLTLQVASDGMAEDTLWANVVTYMWACRYAIVLVDSTDGALNSNVLIEVGGMLMTGRRCAILRDPTVVSMPSDLVGHIYKPTDLGDHDACVAEIHSWIRDDLGLGDCSAPPTL